MQSAPTANGQTVDDPVRDKRSVAALQRLAAGAVFFRSSDGRFYATVRAGRRRETFALNSSAFRDWLVNVHLREHGAMPSDFAVRRAIAAFEATARFDGSSAPTFVRSGRAADGNGNDAVFYLDLADEAGRAVRISADGWAVVDNPPVHFRRPDGHMPLPVPARSGSIKPLRQFINLRDPDYRLLIVWTAAALLPGGPHPILALSGEQGTAKSTLARLVRLLLDPQAAPLLAQPRSARDLMVSAVSGWLLTYDNLSTLPDWLSNGFCMLATSGALAGGASLATDERRVIHAQRPVILNGIGDFVRRGDLNDRTIFLNLLPIIASERRCEDEFWAAFHQVYPRILGGLLDAVVGGLRALPSIRVAELPRMAGFARFAEAVGRSLGWPDGTVLRDFDDNRRFASVPYLEGSALAAFLLDLGLDYFREWTGKPTLLYHELTRFAGKFAESPRWPKSSVRFARELRRLAPQLLLHGFSFEFSRDHCGRVITLKRFDTIPREDDVVPASC
jgi:hypothetical protein